LVASLQFFSELLPLVDMLLSCLRKLPLALLRLRLTFTFGRNRNKQRNPKQTPCPGSRVSCSGAARDAYGGISPAFFLRIVFGLMFAHCVLHNGRLPSLAPFRRWHCYAFKTNACHRDHKRFLCCDARERHAAVHNGSAFLGWFRFQNVGSFELERLNFSAHRRSFVEFHGVLPLFGPALSVSFSRFSAVGFACCLSMPPLLPLQWPVPLLSWCLSMPPMPQSRKKQNGRIVSNSYRLFGLKL
jgi:hypothetical protein